MMHQRYENRCNYEPFPPYLHALLYLTDVIVYYFCAPLPNLNLFALIQLVTPPP